MTRTTLACLILGMTLAGGATLRAQDFDGDGYADLAVGVPQEGIGTADNAGAVSVIYGRPLKVGLDPARNQFIHQNSNGMLGDCETLDRFGYALTWGDWNDDGFDDLAIGIPFQDVNGHPDAGQVAIVFGSSSGLNSSGNALLDLDGFAHANNYANYGWSLASGDFDRDGIQDLAIGIPLRDVPGFGGHYHGQVQILHGAAHPFGSWEFIDQSVLSGETAEDNDHFGNSLAAGDFDGDRFVDLAIGVEEQYFTGLLFVGGVQIAYGSGTGMATRPSTFWTQDSPGILDTAQEYELFGQTLATGNFNGDRYADVAIWIRYEGGSLFTGGAVAVLYGSSTGISSAGNQYIDQNSSGIPGTVDAGDEFGSGLAAGRFDDGNFDDLAIGIPGENGSGAVLIMDGTASGLTATGCVMWTQDSAGILDQSEASDGFGACLCAGAFNNHTTHDDLVVGIPGESVGPGGRAGAIAVLVGDLDGIQSGANQFIHQDTPGMADVAEFPDRFGGSLAR